MDQEVPVFLQKTYGKKLKFKFGEDQLGYTISDRSGEKEFSVPYEAINLKDPTSLFVRSRLLRVILLLAVVYGGIACVAVNIHRTRDDPASVILVIVPLTAFFLAEFFCKNVGKRYTIYQTSNKGPIQIMHGKDYSLISKGLQERWVARLKKLHGAINYDTDIAKEELKFKWLKENEVISEQEYQEILLKLNQWRAGVMDQRSQDPGIRIN
jgi:hypothetical protein